MSDCGCASGGSLLVPHGVSLPEFLRRSSAIMGAKIPGTPCSPRANAPPRLTFLLSNGPGDEPVRTGPFSIDQAAISTTGALTATLLESTGVVGGDAAGQRGVFIRNRLRIGNLRGPWIMQRVTVTIKGSAECDGTFEQECKYQTLEAFRLTVGSGPNERWARPGETGHTPDFNVSDGLGHSGPVDVQKNPVVFNRPDCGLCEGVVEILAEVWEGQAPSGKLAGDVGYVFIKTTVLKEDCSCPKNAKDAEGDKATVEAWGQTAAPSGPSQSYSYSVPWNRCDDPVCMPPGLREPQDVIPIPPREPIPTNPYDPRAPFVPGGRPGERLASITPGVDRPAGLRGTALASMGARARAPSDPARSAFPEALFRRGPIPIGDSEELDLGPGGQER